MCTRRAAGFSLVELVVFIVIVGVALAGVLSVLNVTARSSADPMVRRNMLAIAESLLEEVQNKAFTWCDARDVNAATAVSTAGCTAGDAEVLGPETIASVAETRTSATTAFDTADDYAGLTLASPIPSLSGTYSAPAGYSASIAVTNDAALGPSGQRPASTEVLRIAVTVTTAGNSLTLEGYRTRYAPNTPP